MSKGKTTVNSHRQVSLTMCHVLGIACTQQESLLTDETFSHIRPLPSPGIELGPQRCEAK